MNVFDHIYLENRWNGEESRSGPGSGTAATRRVAPKLVALADEFGVESVLDVGCGDGFWMPDLPGYVGCDASEEAVRRARVNHPGRLYLHGYSPHRSDMVIVRDVIQHLSFDEGVRLLDYASKQARKVLVVSTYVPGRNTNIRDGKFYSPDMTARPFSMRAPDRLIFDGYHYHETDDVRDPAKHLGVWVSGETPTALRGAAEKLGEAMG